MHAAQLHTTARLPETGLLWRIALAVSCVALVLDLVLPGHYPMTLTLIFLPPVSMLYHSFNLTSRLTGLTVLTCTLAGSVAVWQTYPDAMTTMMRSGVVLATLLVGGASSWLLRYSRPATEPQAAALEQFPTMQPTDILERTALVLARLAGASDFKVQRMDQVEEAVSRMISPQRRVPFWQLFEDIELLALQQHPTRPIWDDPKQQRVLIKFSRPAQGNALVILHRPTAPLSFILDAVGMLQVQLERAALLEELNTQRELLRDLVYAFSHDLRTPLTANIISMQAALQGAYGPVSSEFGETLQRNLESSEGLLAISDQLLLVAEYESGGPDAESRSLVDLEEVVRNVMADLIHRARAKNIGIMLTVETALVYGQRFDLRRAVQNLLDNAIKFSPNNTLITASVTRIGQQVRIKVQDHGPGVPPEQQPYLFQRVRGNMPGSGSGVGLYLTRRIAERHGGSVQYAREQGDPPFTAFSLWLPLTDQEKRAAFPRD